METTHNFFRDHYEFILDVCYIALLASLIFFFNLFKGVQIGLVIACALTFIWVLHFQAGGEPPCGSEVSGEPVARSRGGFEPEIKA
ncbi:MAG TPA: hypothetical protein VHX36_14580 [Candidatus Acidoferrales bacterium]|jgi:MFS superfamily sulfate permease-like transporter|nr:hypothetical protein [Candidatus Acidoferrales bacterium]